MSDSVPTAPEAASAVPVVPATAASREFPGQTLGVVALVLSFFLQLPALIMGIIAWNWSNRAGVANTPAKIAVFVSIGLIVLGLLAVIGWAIALASLSTMFEEAFLNSL
jgi:hypothetical protein